MARVLNKRVCGVPPGSVLVDRTTKWGNLFKIGMHYQGRVLDRQGSIEAHRDWLENSDKGVELLKSIHELEGKDLVCWCAPLPCHADLLLELANSPGES